MIWSRTSSPFTWTGIWRGLIITSTLEGTITLITGSRVTASTIVARWLLRSAAAGCVKRGRTSASRTQNRIFRFMGCSSYKGAARAAARAAKKWFELIP